MKMRKRLVALLLVVAMVLSMAASALAATPTDTGSLPTDVKADIQRLIDAGIVSGYPDGTFKPDGTLTRGDFAKYVVNAAGLAEEKPATPSFKDVGASMANYGFIEAAAKAKIIQGFLDGTYGPTVSITKGQAAVIALRLMGKSPGGSYANEVKAAVAEGLLESAAVSAQTATRAQAAVVIVDTGLVPESPVATKVEFSASKASLAVGEIFKFVAGAVDKDGKAVADAKIIYAVTGDIGTIAADGTLTATKAGTGKVTATSGTISASVDVTVVGLAVKEATNASAKAIKVTFNAAVSDTSAVSFSVKRDASIIYVTAAWSADKTSATLTASGSLAAGTYTVKASGVTLATDTATVIFTAERAAKIEISSANLTKTGANTATAKYVVYNQYNEDVTKTALSGGINWVSSLGVVADANKGTATAGTITVTKAWVDADKTVTVTAVDPATGTTVTKTLDLAAAAQLSTAALTGVGYWTTTPATTRLYTGAANAGIITFNFADQYGNALTTYKQVNDAVVAGDIQFIVSDAALVVTITDKDKGADPTKEARINVSTAAMAAAKKVVVTAVIPSKGLTSSITLDVVTAGAPWEVTSLTAPTTVIASGDAIGSVVIGLAAKNQFGEELTADQIAANAGAFTVTSTGGAFAIAVAGANKGKLVNTAAIGAKGTYTITVTATASTSANKSGTVSISASDARYPASLSVKTAPSNKLLQGASTKIQYLLKDQYGVDLADADVAAYSVKVLISKISGDDVVNAITADPSNTYADEALIQGNDLTITSAATKKGSYKLTAQILDGSNDVVSQDERVIDVIAEADYTLTYTLDAIPTLYAKGGADFTVKYAKSVVVSAKDETGATVSLPSTYIAGIISSNGTVLSTDLASKKVLGLAKGTATLSVIINTASGPKSLQQTITVVDDALVAQKVEAQDAANKAITAYTFADDVALKAGIVVNNSTSAFHYVVTDQFGGTDLTGALTYFVTNTSGITAADAEAISVTIAAGVATLAISDPSSDGITSTWAAGTKFKVTAVTSNGLLSTIEVTITAAN